MKFTRLYSEPGRAAWEQIEWRLATSRITAPDGTIVFEQANVEVPSLWSETAVNVLAQKYLRKAGVPSVTSLAPIIAPGLPFFLRPSQPAPGATFGAERSMRQVCHRLAGCWAYWGWREGVFAGDEESALIFYDEAYLMLACQIGAPNSPQFFNTGLHWAYGISAEAPGHWATDPVTGAGSQVADPLPCANIYERPQPSACFIQSVRDDLVGAGGIMDLWTREVRLFKYGSGSGSNLSAIRGKGEKLSGGGTSSGLMSFLPIGDRAAGSIKSGGTTRRAALMRCLDLDHPEIEDFIDWKVREEEKAAAIAVGSRVIADRLNDVGASTHARDADDYSTDAARAAGVPEALIDRARSGDYEWLTYDLGFEGEAIETVSGQNANNSVRVTDEFLRRVDEDGDWEMLARTTGEVVKTVKARALWDQIAHAAWACADPGVQFDTTINDWHTCPADGRIEASNPCCFVGCTFIDTDAGFITIEELARMSDQGETLPRAFCFDTTTQLPALRQIKKAWLAGHANRLTQVTTASGQVLRCTPDHPWMVRRVNYVQAKNLRIGSSLQKINREINKYRSNRVALTHRSTFTSPKGRISQSRFVWEQVHGDIPVGYDVHHKNDDPTDDRLSNLVLIKNGMHQSQHSSGSHNPRFIPVDDAILIEIYDAIARQPRMTHKLKSGVTPGRWNDYVRKNGLLGTVPMAQSPTIGGNIQGLPWDKFLERISLARALVNDTVQAVEQIDLTDAISVYDIEVEDCHNFGIRSDNTQNASSIIVHNSEYIFLNDTACNLASLRLTAFLLPDGELNLNAYEHAARLWTTVLEISVYMASYPGKEIARRSHLYRTLGLGYADLGGLLMRLGLAYDSNDGRSLAAGLTALLTGVAYQTSAELAEELGPFPRWTTNRGAMRRVLICHMNALTGGLRVGDASLHVAPPYQNIEDAFPELYARAAIAWNAVSRVESVRNAQVTLLAPTGTIALLMDCDTTGVEPDFALVKHKALAGGGTIRMVNQAVEESLRRLGYDQPAVDYLLRYVQDEGRLAGAALLKPEHLAVFDCAVGERSLIPMAHVKMVAAVQPFLSGAVSKTINLPNGATIADVRDLYRAAHRLGLKSVAVYRDGSKLTQPLATVEPRLLDNPAVARALGEKWDGTARVDQFAQRRRLPNQRRGHTQKATLDGHRIYLHTGEYEDGSLGEIFIDLAKEGEALGSFANLLAIAVSIGLQHGVPLAEFVDAFTFTRFEPAGVVTDHARIKMATSLADYLFRHLAIHYLGREDLAHVNITVNSPIVAVDRQQQKIHSGELCPNCRNFTMTRSGTCRRCDTCGETSGCS